MNFLVLFQVADKQRKWRTLSRRCDKVSGGVVDMLPPSDVTRWSMNFGDYEDGYDDFSADGFNYSRSLFNFSLREAIRVLQEHRQSRRVFPPDAEIVLIVFYSVLITTGKLWLSEPVAIPTIKNSFSNLFNLKDKAPDRNARRSGWKSWVYWRYFYYSL